MVLHVATVKLPHARPPGQVPAVLVDIQKVTLTLKLQLLGHILRRM